DVAGKGWLAYVLARALLLAWRQAVFVDKKQPDGCLRAVDEAVRGRLPIGLFAEMAMATFDAEGRGEFGGLGHVVLWSRVMGNQLIYKRLSGTPVGLEELEYDCSWTPHQLSPGDEFSLSSDGLTDQPCSSGKLQARLTSDLLERTHRSTLHDA